MAKAPRTLTAAQYEALFAIARAAAGRLEAHDKLVRAAGGRRCEDDYCLTFRPLVRRLKAANRGAD
jgi:hypothetical protein